MAVVVELKYIAYRHVANGAYPPTSFVLSGAVAHLPVAITESLVFCAILYWMAGMAPNADRFFYFWFIAFQVDIFMRNLMALFSFVGKTIQMAQAYPLPLIAFMTLLAGFVITRDNLGWLLFANYIDPLGWAVRGLALNEFGAPRYNIPLGLTGVTLGQTYLDEFDMGSDDNYRWGAIAYLAACALIVVVGSLVAFNRVRHDRNIGSRRDATGENATLSTAGAVTLRALGTTTRELSLVDMSTKKVIDPSVAIDAAGEADTAAAASAAGVTKVVAAVPHHTVVTTSVLPFEPMTVVFRDIKFV